MKPFEFEDYKKFVREKLKTFPRGGHGQFLRIAKLLSIHTTMVTHIFKGDSNLSVEQALALADYFALSPLETEHFVTMVQMARASNAQSRAYFRKQMSELKTRALNLSERLQARKSLSEADQAIFYSSWFYSGIRLLIATRDFKGPEEISEVIGLPLVTVARALEFLVSRRLVQQNGGKYEVGETLTYVGRDSPFVNKHHLNWRMKAIQQLDHVPDDELVFTNSIAISEADFQRVREEIVSFLERYKAIGDPSPSERLCFLTIDWRKFRLAGT
jgi:uncharacterized protein (TIGR02147 family)